MSVSWGGPEEGADEHIRNAIAILKGTAANIAELATDLVAAEARLEKALADMPSTSDIPSADEVLFMERVLLSVREDDLHKEAVSAVRMLLKIHHERRPHA